MSFSTRRARRVGRQALLVIAVSFVVLGATGFLVLAATAWGVAERLVGNLPDLNAPAPPVQETTKIFARDGTLLADLFYSENRVPISLGKMPNVLIDAVIAAEDKRFFSHRGVDFESIARAIVADIRSGRIVEGGSTITQQYIKNLYGQRDRTLKRKIREALLAYQLEQRYPKNLILERYLNTIYLGQSAYGVEAASRMYFGKSARRVSLAEAALLAGLIRAPNSASPYAFPAAARDRRDRVLDQMLQQQMITTSQAQAAIRAPIRVLQPRAPKGRAVYFVEYVKQELIRQFGADMVFKGGLRVYTTLDLNTQAEAERAAWGILDRPDDPSVALVAIEPATGQIRAMVGGRDFARLRYNLATQGHRQPGSAFKPFVLATALAQGYSLDSQIDSTPGDLKLPDGSHWSVSNATEGGGGGLISVLDATIHSVNAAFARIMIDVGPDAVATTAERMGITTPLNRDFAIALGGMKTGVTPLEMANAYGTLATGGFHVAPTPVFEIRNAFGRLISKPSVDRESVLDPGVAALITKALEGVVSSGTGHRAQIGRPAAGKTGTTTNYHDAWFIGYTPQLVTSVWVGYPKKQREMSDVHGIRVAGGTFPAQIWAAFMREALAGAAPAQFGGVPKGSMVKVKICSQTNLLATPYCPHPIVASFLAGQEPKSFCAVHTAPPAPVVPGLVGMNVGKASALLAAKGFVPVATYVQSTKAVGVVLDQSPQAGRTAPSGTVVTLTVSSGAAANPADQPPRAAFTISNSNPRLSQRVTFDGSVSSDPENDLVRWEWIFGDGATATGVRASHVYPAAGTYSVTLTVYDKAGQASSVAQGVTVLP